MKQVIDAHFEEYETQPDIIVSAPARVHLIGEHTWYFKDKTVSMAVNLPVYVAASVRNDSSLRFHFTQQKERKRGNLSTLKFRKEDRWANALKAVMYGFQSCGFDCKGLNITVFSEILPSAGFGITTAMKVATALALRALFNKEMTDVQMIQAVERGNTYFLNTGHYLADINTALYSEENTFLLTDHQKSTKTFLPFNFPEYSIVLTDARVPRISVWDEETIRTPENFLLMAELKNQKNGYWVYEESSVEINDILSCVNEDTRRRLICIMKEHKNVMDAADSLKNGNFNGFARAVNKSHEFMRDLYTISCPEIDWLVKRVLEFDMTSSRNPTACSRITGKGFGRCSYTMIKNTDVDEYFKKITEYERIFGFHPACYIVKPSGGAKIVYQ
jgi:galactokinase